MTADPTATGTPLRWPNSIKLAATLAYLAIVVIPVVGTVVLLIPAVRQFGYETVLQDQGLPLLCFLMVVGFVPTALSLAWILWGIAPRLVQDYTVCWAMMWFPVTGWLALRIASADTPDTIYEVVAGIAAIAGALGLAGAAVVAIPLALVIWVVRRIDVLINP